MIFGFNTDITYAGTLYHVQSEARVADLLIQTQVFVQGRCVGKHATSYAEQAARAGFSEGEIHELLKQQHRLVLDTVREGRLDTLLAARGAVSDASGNGLALEWLNAPAVYVSGTLRLRFRVTRDGKAVSGAHVTCRLTVSDEAPVHSESLTAADGIAEIAVALTRSAAPEVSVLVQATHEGSSASRKFRLKRTGN